MERQGPFYAIVQWEDSFTSVINLNTVIHPEKAAHLFTEGEYVVALFGKKKYKARISDISDKKRTLISQQTSDGKFPLQYLYEVMETPVECMDDSVVMQLSDEFEEGDGLDCDPGISSLDTEQQAKGLEKSPPDSASSCNCKSPLNTLDESSGKVLERRVSKLEKDLKKLKETVKSLTSSEVDTHTAASAANPDKDMEDLLSRVKHLSASNEKEINECIKRLCFMVFNKNELATSSRTGKKTFRSGENVKPALDQSKLQLLERAALIKCETLTNDLFRKKIDNIIKMERRSEKGKKENN